MWAKENFGTSTASAKGTNNSPADPNAVTAAPVAAMPFKNVRLFIIPPILSTGNMEHETAAAGKIDIFHVNCQEQINSGSSPA
jgi:hypothetical protein